MELNELVATVRALGWSLVHFLWQGALIALVLELVLVAMRGSSSGARYVARCLALAAMGVAPVVTFLVLRSAAVQDPALVVGPAAEPVSLQAELWLTLIVALWLVGAAAFGARLARDYVRIRRVQSAGAGAPLPAEWQARFDELASALGVRAVARVVDSAAVRVPTVIGWVRPMVLVPARVLTGLDPEQVAALLAHELAHVRRHDYLVNLIQSALEAALFYHPAVWFVSKGIRAEREFCCDDVALRVTTDRVSYARALTTLESWRGAELQTAMSTLGGSLMHRIQRMVGTRPSNTRARRPLTALAALLAVTTLGATAFATPAVQNSDELREIRARVEEMQAHLDQLRSMLDRALGDVDAADTQLHADEAEEPQAAHSNVEVRFHDPSGNVVTESVHEEGADCSGDCVRVIEVKKKTKEQNEKKDEKRGAAKKLHTQSLFEHLHEALRAHGVEWGDDEDEVHEHDHGHHRGHRNVVIERRSDDGEGARRFELRSDMDVEKLHEHLQEVMGNVHVIVEDALGDAHETVIDALEGVEIEGLDLEGLLDDLDIDVDGRHGIVIGGHDVHEHVEKLHEHLMKRFGEHGEHGEHGENKRKGASIFWRRPKEQSSEGDAKFEFRFGGRDDDGEPRTFFGTRKAPHHGDHDGDHGGKRHFELRFGGDGAHPRTLWFGQGDEGKKSKKKKLQFRRGDADGKTFFFQNDDGGTRRIEIRIDGDVDGDFDGLHETIRKALEGLDIDIRTDEDDCDDEGEDEGASKSSGQSRLARLV